MKRTLTVLLCTTFLIFASACGSDAQLPTTVARATVASGTVAQVGRPTVVGATEPAGVDMARATPTLIEPTSTAEATATTAPTATPSPLRISVEPGVPVEIINSLRDFVAEPGQAFVLVPSGDEADVRVLANGGEPIANWVYAVVVPFATLDEATTLGDLQTNWRSGGAPQALVDGTSGPLLTAAWGQGMAQIVDGAQLAAELWNRRPAWSIVPFNRLEPSMKVLSVDGISPLDAAFDGADYPLAFSVGLEGDTQAVAALHEAWDAPQTNRDAQRITRLAMTGVMALVRATAYQMEIRGLSYPGEEVGPVLREADLAHVSNEVSFVPDCPPPHYIGDPVFCSSPRYMSLLEEIGVDVVELTGNHLNDWGAQYLPYTLDLYDQAGMQYFGGGRDLAAAQEPLLIEHHGNRLAFVGCNPVGPFGGWAAAERAGSAPCDMAAFRAQIGALSEAGQVVIATQQYQELYHYAPTAQQRADFRALAEAGAAAVSGSQGHHAQGFDFHAGAFIHYGLGNLFFDQMDMLGTRQTMVDIYTIYENRIVSVEMWTGLIEDYARPRLMTDAERRDLLQTLFTASGW